MASANSQHPWHSLCPALCLMAGCILSARPTDTCLDAQCSERRGGCGRGRPCRCNQNAKVRTRVARAAGNHAWADHAQPSHSGRAHARQSKGAQPLQSVPKPAGCAGASRVPPQPLHASGEAHSRCKACSTGRPGRRLWGTRPNRPPRPQCCSGAQALQATVASASTAGQTSQPSRRVQSATLMTRRQALVAAPAARAAPAASAVSSGRTRSGARRKRFPHITCAAPLSRIRNRRNSTAQRTRMPQWAAPHSACTHRANLASRLQRERARAHFIGRRPSPLEAVTRASPHHIKYRTVFVQAMDKHGPHLAEIQAHG